MHVFVTGATGFIGKAVVQELLKAGHRVSGLARSDEGAELLKRLGAEVHRGSLEDLDSLKSGAAASDGVIHLAFIHDFSDYDGSCRTDRQAIEAIGEAIAGSNKPLIITSGTLMLPQGRLVNEQDTPDLTNPIAAARGASEEVVLSLVPKGVRAAIVRLPPTNHGDGDHGFIARLVAIAKEKGVSAYLEGGLNRWPAVHHLDTARVYRLALENNTASGAVFHAVAEESVTIKAIAEAIGEKLSVPVVSKTQSEGQEHFGFLAFALLSDNPTSNTQTRVQLGWEPVHPSLVADLEHGSYFG